jgi:SAM-dependent methyltransferase
MRPVLPAAVGTHAEPAPALSPELLALPAPRHLHEFLVRSQHLHLGYFESTSETLAQAQDRLILRALRHLPRNALVVDVGCGLGGTVSLLAAHGHRVFGLDPCSATLAYARARMRSPRVQFLHYDLAQFAVRARGARFDALLLTEVLPSFPDLGALFGRLRALLRPGGITLVHDVVRQRPSRQGQGFHERGALRGAADAAGFDLLESREPTSRVTPTLVRLGRLLDERRTELQAAFGPSRPSIAQEIAEYRSSLRELELGFARGELVYETTVLRCSARLGTDSVVLRAPARTAARPGPEAPLS